MPDPASLSASSVDLPEAQLVTATILDNAGAPTDLVRAYTDGDPDHAIGDLRWTPVVHPVGLFYPKKGDIATVAFPEGPDADPVIVEWSPSAAEPDHAF